MEVLVIVEVPALVEVPVMVEVPSVVVLVEVPDHMETEFDRVVGKNGTLSSSKLSSDAGFLAVYDQWCIHWILLNSC